MDLNEAAQHVRPKIAGFYDGLTVDGIRLANPINGGVYWEARDGGPVHLHIDPDPRLKALILAIRGKLTSGSLEMHEFDAACREHGLEPWKWEVEHA